MTKEEMIFKTERCIGELVYEKQDLQKAYNYYHGIRDKRQFQYLEENFGIGNPTSVTFTPLVKKHIDYLIGEYLGIPATPKISCKDPETVSGMMRERDLEVDNMVFKFLKGHLMNSLLRFIDGKDMVDKDVKARLDRLVEDVDESFVSKYEVAAQNVVEYVMQSSATDMRNRRKELFRDVLITGMPYFKVNESPGGNDVEIELVDPMNAFLEMSPNSIYAKDATRSVVRRWLSKDEILARYGGELSERDRKTVADGWEEMAEFGWYTMTLRGACPAPAGYLEPTTDKRAGEPATEYSAMQMRLLPVYEVEWLETDSDNVMQRYETIRLGADMYILRGRDEHAIRSHSDPRRTRLRLNGVQFYDRTRKPFSLMLSCMDIQDRYDLLIFYRDNMIASSGTKGGYIDYSMIPKVMGDKFDDRVAKWIAYKKQGHGVIDSSQEGRANNGQAPLNTIYSGYDETVSRDATAAINETLEAYEETLSSITGVFRERLNNIEQYDAVTNVKQGVRNSFTITRQWYDQMDTVVRELLTDCLDVAKRVWRGGLCGTLRLGDGRQRVFTALPDEFTVTDYDVYVTSTSEILQDMETIKGLVPQLISSNTLPADVLVEAMTCRSMAELKMLIRKAMRRQKEENDQVAQLTKQLEETTQQSQQLQMQLQQTQQELATLNKEKMAIEREKVRLEYKVDWYKAQTDRTYKEERVDIDRTLARNELEQTMDRNPYNNTIRRIGTADLS